MPKEPTKVHKYKDECTERCAIHGDELLKFYCKNHNQFGCTICITLEHRTCKVGYIPTISADIIESDEFKAFKSDIESLIKQVNSIDIASKENVNDAKRHADESLGKVRQLRDKFNNIFDKLEKKIVDEIAKIRTEDQEKMTDISKRCGVISYELHKLQSDISDKETKNQKCKLFVETKRNKNGQFRDEISKLCLENQIRQTVFIHPHEVAKSLNNFSLGSAVFLKRRYECRTLTTHLEEDIDSITHGSGCIVVLYQSIEKLQDRFNRYNIRIELQLDNKWGEKEIVSQYTEYGVKPRTFEKWKKDGAYKPCGMTTMPDGNIAVKIENFIKIYSVTYKIELELQIKSTGLSNKPIAFANDTFIAVTSTSPPAVCLINMDGKITKTLPTEVNGKVLFDSPTSIAVHPDQTTMYVLDSGMKTVTSLTIDGEMWAHYKPVHAWEPRDLVVSRDGLVYVSDGVTNNISILSPDLQEISVIHGDQHGIYNPRSLAYCGKEHKLYVVSGERDIVVLDL